MLVSWRAALTWLSSSTLLSLASSTSVSWAIFWNVENIAC